MLIFTFLGFSQAAVISESMPDYAKRILYPDFFPTGKEVRVHTVKICFARSSCLCIFTFTPTMESS